MAIIDTGSSTAGKANVDSQYNLMANVPGYTSGGVVQGGGPEHGPTMFSEVDSGNVTGVRDVLSPEVDDDYRLRAAHDNMLDQELFNYTSQNTGKHLYAFTTLTSTASASGILTNSGSITTTTTGCTLGTRAYFPVGGTQTTVVETSVSFSAQPSANVVIDFGLFIQAAANPFAPADGIYFRLSSAGLEGVICNAGVEVATTGVFPSALGAGTYTYTNGAVNRYLIQISNVATTFWINNVKVGEIVTPVGQNFPCRAQALPWAMRHAIVGGAAGAVLQARFSDYRVYIRGQQFSGSIGETGNRVLGSYQGLSGGTMGQLVAGTVTSGTLVKPTAAVPANTSLVANLPNSLAGRAFEQLTAGLAVNTDGILASYTVPAGSTTVQGRRLKVVGIKLASSIQTVVAGGPVTNEYYIAFGHTADSLATAESSSFATATTKAPRRVMLPEFTQVITAAQAVNTMVSQPLGGTAIFPEPIFVNPGERIALVVNKYGTALTSGVIAHSYQFIYSWE